MARMLPKTYRTEDEADAFAVAELRIEMARINQAKELGFLDLGCLTKLPDSIEQLTDLRSLDLTNNHLSELPDSLGNLTQLHNLNLSRNKFTELPDVIEQLRQLQILNLSRNQITDLPSFIGQFPEMKTLYLSRNKFGSIPESITRLTKLRELYLSKNEFTQLPEVIGQLSQLGKLDLFGNKLTALPETITKLTQLRELYLQNNNLTELPVNIGLLKQLRLLSLEGNNLFALPESIGEIEQLAELNLTNNKLEDLPPSLKNLKQLRRLFLHGNKLTIDPVVLGASADDVIRKKARPASARNILNIYFRILEASRPLNEAKLILVGRGGVGKTSIVNRLIFNRFDKNLKETKGINIKDKEIILKNGENVRLNIWDFGGQEIMHGTHQFFLTKRSIYLLVLSGREGNAENDVRYWLKLIESYGENSSVIIVLNKIDEHNFDINRTNLLSEFGDKIRGFVETDCETRKGIDKLKSIIEDVTDKLEDLRTPFPSTWFSIKEKLLKEKRNFISFKDYLEICEKAGEKDHQAKLTLADYLNDLGLIYKKNSQNNRISETYVLNPHWITNGIYAILNSEKIRKQKGEFYLSDLNIILDRRAYPSDKHPFLVELMKEFELCFSLNNKQDYFLIPDLIKKNEPTDKISEFDRKNCLNFEYRCKVLPEGLMPRFITRTFNLSRKDTRWHEGVILFFSNSRALVKANLSEKKISISVNGEKEHRRELLNIIRYEFEKIHGHLNPEEFVSLPGHPETLISYQALLKREEINKPTFEVLAGDETVKVEVSQMLDEFDIDRAYQRESKLLGYKPKKVSIFISYSRKDEHLRKELNAHIIIMERQGWIDIWYDRKIAPGKNWKDEIDENLRQANIVLLLISPDFFYSDYCYKEEMSVALERHNNGETVVIPVIIRDCNWKKIALFAELNCLPKSFDFVWNQEIGNRDSAWRDVSEGIQEVVEKIRGISLTS